MQHRLQKLFPERGKLPLKLTCPAGTSICPATLLNKGEIGLCPKHYLLIGASHGLVQLAPMPFSAKFTCNLQWGQWLCCTLVMLWVEENVIRILAKIPFQCWGYFRLKHKDSKICEDHLYPFMLVFIGHYSRWVLSDEYPSARVLVIFQCFFASFCIDQISRLSSIRVYNITT